MKTKYLIITLFFISIISCKKETKNDIINNSEITNTIKNGDFCYQYIIENSYKIKDSIIIENDFINISLTLNNNNVIGNYKLTSKNEVPINGTFKGKLKNNIITSIHTYKRDSIISKDELILKVENNQLSILGGEKELINGINMFINKDNGEYILNLNKINCN